MLSADYNSDGTRSRRFPSVPQPALDNKPTEIIIGNAFGGSSKINGMIYSRGFPSQFKAWSLQGRQGWSYDDLHPYFLKSEGALNKTEEEKYHNLKGSIKIAFQIRIISFIYRISHLIRRMEKPFEFTMRLCHIAQVRFFFIQSFHAVEHSTTIKYDQRR